MPRPVSSRSGSSPSTPATARSPANRVRPTPTRSQTPSGRRSGFTLRAVQRGLAIAQVTPFAWEASNEVNHHVERVSSELARRGHRVLVIAPSESATLVREGRRAIREQGEGLLEQADGQPLVLGIGEVLPFSPARRRAAS